MWLGPGVEEAVLSSDLPSVSARMKGLSKLWYESFSY
jgi:hypothetical protein